MDNNVKRLLDDEIVTTLKEIAMTEPESDEGKTLMKKLVDLYTQRLKEEDLEEKAAKRLEDTIQSRDALELKDKELNLRVAEANAKIAQFNIESELKAQELRIREAELAEARKDRKTRAVIEVAGITVPLVVSSYWMFKGLKFEETGCYSSRTMQWLSTHLRLFRR